MSMPIPPFYTEIGPVPNITPFTYRDGRTYLDKLTGLVYWANNSLVPQMNEAVEIVINDGIQVQEPVVNGILENITSNSWKTVQKRLALLSVQDYGVVGDNVTDDTAAFNLAIAAAIAQEKTLWIPAGLAGVRLTSTVNARYLDVQFDSPITIDHNTDVGIILGDNSQNTTRRRISFWRVWNKSTTGTTSPKPAIPSIRFVGLKSAYVEAGSCDYIQLYTNAAVPADTSIAYCSFYMTGGLTNFIEFVGSNGTSWVNDNKFFGGRFRALEMLLANNTYSPNGNKWFGSTFENSTIVMERGYNNAFMNVRFEGDSTITLGALTFGNVFEASYTNFQGNIAAPITTTDLGVNNFVGTVTAFYLNSIEIARFDRYTKIYNASSEYPSVTAGVPIPGLRNIQVRASNQDFLDTGILPIELNGASVIAEGDEKTNRVDLLHIMCSHNSIVRPRVYCYDANMVLMDPTASELISGNGGWNANVAGYYGKSATSPSNRIIVLDKNVKFLRITISSSTTGQPAFDWLSLRMFVKRPNSDSIAEVWKRALARKPAQASAPTQGIGNVGDKVESSSTSASWKCVFRFDGTAQNAVAALANTVTAAAVTGIAVNDVIGILMSNNNTHWTTVSAIAGNVLTLNTAVPVNVLAGAPFIVNRWL